MNLWPFIEVEEAEQRNVARTCALLEVSRAAYYEQRKHIPSARSLDDAELTTRIQAIHDSSKGTYGAPRIHAQLRRDGVHCGKKRVARLMVRAGLAGRCPRKWRKTTIADPNAEARGVDLIKRVFGPGKKLDTRWCGDITYIPTWEGWAYLATVIDLNRPGFDGGSLGWISRSGLRPPRRPDHYTTGGPEGSRVEQLFNRHGFAAAG